MPLPSFKEKDVKLTERRHTDGVSVNFNGQFADDGDEVVFVSERAVAAGLFLGRLGCDRAEELPAVEGSLFHDRSTTRDMRMYFVSAQQKSPVPFRSLGTGHKQTGRGKGHNTHGPRMVQKNYFKV
ncbi:hypothetical protein GUJ93_ZPchr0004g39545 [Zizania palustris]|uniref:Uncharacterized protein n=1 Tax=Zizania palustris TaxID=103762 RepID=A0A8J5SI77_ZIZPA|nr:hypothetical protein GUJ93_ZPchr0004g39545 [Zizania palustris]